MKRSHALLLCLALAGCGGGPRQPSGPSVSQGDGPPKMPPLKPTRHEGEGPQVQCGADLPPEGDTGRRAVKLARSKEFMAGAANPYAAKAGHDVLAEGGSAVDAAVAMAMVLTLVEPQSSGLGGGGFLLHYDAAEKKVRAYDGRETAPAAATPDMFAELIGPSGKRDFKAHMSGVVSGRSVGVPGLLRMLALAQAKHGKLPWKRLMAPAIRLATEGFVVSPRLVGLIEADMKMPEPLRLCSQPSAKGYFCPEGKPLVPGTVRKNPALAALLVAIAERGPDALYTGAIAKDIVEAVQRAPRMPGALSIKDMNDYQPVIREPICIDHGPEADGKRRHRVCGMPPPTSGGIAVIQILGILDRLHTEGMGDGLSAHLLADAGRAAYADRNQFVADPRAMTVDPMRLVNEGYLKARAEAIDQARTTGPVQPVQLEEAGALGRDDSPELPSTSHLVAVDKEGNAVSMTASIEHAFGSRIFVHGVLLNNQLTDFSFLPTDEAGRPKANRVEGGKRPRSSMAPMLILDGRDGTFEMAVGSPGGSRIIGYVAQVLFEVLHRGKDVQAAIDAPHVLNRNDACTEVERPIKGGEARAQALVEALQARGHGVKVTTLNSGLHALRKTPEGYEGGADPRREGMLYGDGAPPPEQPAVDLPQRP